MDIPSERLSAAAAVLKRLRDARTSAHALSMTTSSTVVADPQQHASTTANDADAQLQYSSLKNAVPQIPTVPYVLHTHVATIAGLAQMTQVGGSVQDLPLRHPQMHPDTQTARIVVPPHVAAPMQAYGASEARATAFSASCSSETMAIDGYLVFEGGRPAPPRIAATAAAASVQGQGESMAWRDQVEDKAAGESNHQRFARVRAAASDTEQAWPAAQPAAMNLTNQPGLYMAPAPRADEIAAHYDAIGAVVAQQLPSASALSSRARTGAAVRQRHPTQATGQDTAALKASLAAFRCGLQQLEHRRRAANAGLCRDPAGPVSGVRYSLMSYGATGAQQWTVRDSPYVCW